MKILIIGMREKEKIRLLKKHKDKDLNFIVSDSITNKSLKDLSKYSYVINMCKFSTHLVEYMCNTHKGFIRLRPNQGISSINNILENLYV